MQLYDKYSLQSKNDSDRSSKIHIFQFYRKTQSEIQTVDFNFVYHPRYDVRVGTMNLVNQNVERFYRVKKKNLTKRKCTGSNTE